ncbi:hypothetical protein BU24DRAFT_358846 [Aaosphaeria arxii CBS 175.79]|uniref:Zn(2)-C6 fungal-type domain-containing protein n=1 Tax=Aaosphaeria arxii CBS 175.79 TaxID=1450172 RepID=A0A6A5X8E7_9PLEO|nr:uncharacterized protein BU24DRAFT_358846 [Aaosphaeria arxii CBS 175.79]KAF2009228.1 hypothetical protein BU24DRAFT_358846 [Aaosphaeria arxii CBS 175.79]
MAVTTARAAAQVARSACDRCYQLKERCKRASITSSCERCERLEQVCLTVRPILPTGRRKKRCGHAVTQVKPSRSISTIDTLRHVSSWLRENTDLSPDEKELMMFLLRDSPPLQYSVVGPRHADAEQESFASQLPSSWPVLKDAYLAYAGVLKLLAQGSTTEIDENSIIRHTTAAMIALRQLPITNSNDAKLCLQLGFALAFSVYAIVGVGVSDICQYCLSITRSFTEDGTIDPGTESRISFLVLLETTECLVRRQKPTLRLQPRAPGSVDRHLGLCLPLLPYYHDLCVISYSLVNGTDLNCTGLLQKQLSEIQGQVDKWQPSHPEGFLHQYSTAEVIHLLAQAKVYRLAALLMIHRLQYLFGQKDSQADIWSREIMMELDLARRISNQPARFVTVPFIIAAIETRDATEREKVNQNVDLYVDQFTPVVQKATKTFLWRVWRERDERVDCSWFDMIHKPCVAFDSIVGSFLG